MPRPNVVVILADDVGFADIGAFGGEIDTPNLDRLAGEGVRMSSFYVTPRCSPSRAALLTGRHPHSVGVGILTHDDRPNGYAGSIDPDVPTLAQQLHDVGYRTAVVGKWHLASDVETPNGSWPTRKGFDEFYGILPGAASYYKPYLQRGDAKLPESASAAEDYYFTDDIAGEASAFIERTTDAGTPFLLYFALTAPHWPLHAAEEAIARYRERYRAGWDALRDARFARQRELGLTLAPELPPRDDEVPPWADEPHQDWQAERMAVYAAQVEALDRAVGRVLDALERAGVADDTLVTFSSDNGACAEDLQEGEGWASLWRICPPATRDGRPVRIGDQPEILPGPEDTYTSYGRSWANLSNTPFRLYKRWVHEGGIASPLIARWPAGGVSGGALVDGPGHLVDVLPTLVEAAGAAEPADVAGSSLLPVWRGGRREERALCWEHIGNAAIRRGRWKLVREVDGPWELYDLEVDRGETADLAGDRPELVAELEAVWLDWAAANEVIPWDRVVADYAARGLVNPEDG